MAALQFLATGEIPWTEEPAGLLGSKRSWTQQQLNNNNDVPGARQEIVGLR